MAQYLEDLLSTLASCFFCFPSSPQLRINSRSFKILRLLGEVHSQTPDSLYPIHAHYELREAFHTSISFRKLQLAICMPSRKSGVHSDKNPSPWHLKKSKLIPSSLRTQTLFHLSTTALHLQKIRQTQEARLSIYFSPTIDEGTSKMPSTPILSITPDFLNEGSWSCSLVWLTH